MECKGWEWEWKHCTKRSIGGPEKWKVKSCVLLCQGHGDSRALGVIKTVHSAELHDHVEAVGEHQDHEKTGHQTHPDTRREEACTVAGIREVTAGHVKALDLWRESCKKNNRVLISL